MKFVDGLTVGIDLGTTFSAIAHLDQHGEPQPIANEDDEVETPSLVLFTEGGQVIVGPSRQRAAMEDPARVVERIKRDMGNPEYKRVINGQSMSPEFISALVLKKLVKDAEKRIGKIGNAVITVPYYFNDARRKATEDAGRIAGLNVVDIINEPTAATLMYAWKEGSLGVQTGHQTDARTALVYDLGGGTFDVTVVKFTANSFEVLATDGDVHLGGVDWTDRLVDHLSDAFLEQHGVDPRESLQALQMLRNDCDLAKLRLSTDAKTKLSCRFEGKLAAVEVDRETFESMTEDLLQRTLDTTDLVLDMANLPDRRVDQIVLVGGSTLMPKVAASLESLTGVVPYRKLSPHTAVAQGAAIHAAILEAKHRGTGHLGEKLKDRLAAIQQQDVNSHGLGVLIRDRAGRYRNHIMIPRNSRIPIEINRTFDTAEANQERVTVRVVEGDASDPEACSMLGKCTVNLPPKLPKGSPIEVSYSYTSAGRVVVSAKDKTSGRAAKISIERSGGLSDDQLSDFAKLARDYKIE